MQGFPRPPRAQQFTTQPTERRKTRCPLSEELKKNQEVGTRHQRSRLSQGSLGFADWKYNQAIPRSVLREKETLRILLVKLAFLSLSPAFSAPGLVRCNPQDDPGLDKGSQVVWVQVHSFLVLQGIIGGLSGSCVQALLQGWAVGKFTFPGLLEQESNRFLVFQST